MFVCFVLVYVVLSLLR